MTVVLRAPTSALAPFVERLGCYNGEVPRGREPVLPTGTMHLLVNLAEDQVRWYEGSDGATVHTRRPAVLTAPCPVPSSVDLAEWQAVVFVCFRPGGAHPLMGPPASTIDEPLVELDELWGRDGAVLRERLLDAPTAEAGLTVLEQVLLANFVRPPERDPAITWAVSALGRGMPVSEVVDRLGLSHSTLLRRFSTQVGLTPKRFARIRRLHRLLASIPTGPSVDWAAAATAFGYFDQAHLIRHMTRAVVCRYTPNQVQDNGRISPCLLWSNRWPRPTRVPGRHTSTR